MLLKEGLSWRIIVVNIVSNIVEYTMTPIEHVLAVVKGENTSFEQDEMTNEQIAFSSREYAKSGNQPGEEDLEEASRLVSVVGAAVPKITGTVDCVDEWVFVTFRTND